MSESACRGKLDVYSAYYVVGFAPFIAMTLVWLALRHVHQYRELRTALLVSI